MGWSSWNKSEDKIDDKTIREVADAMVATGLRDAGSYLTGRYSRLFLHSSKWESSSDGSSEANA